MADFFGTMMAGTCGVQILVLYVGTGAVVASGFSRDTLVFEDFTAFFEGTDFRFEPHA
jgi:hypothetical protein